MTPIELILTIIYALFNHSELTESEQNDLRGLISAETENLVNKETKTIPQITFYKSIYETLYDESQELKLLARIAQMAHFRTSQSTNFSSAVKDTSWGISGTRLTKLTDFENVFTNFTYTPTVSETESPQTTTRKTVDASQTAVVGHRITFISPKDGKAAIIRVTQLLSKAVKLGLIREEDVDQAMIHALLNSPEGELWPSPDLLINFKDTPVTAGYPNWHLRYAEIVNAGQLGSGLPLVWHQFHKALCTFSKTVQRYGK